MFSTFQALKYLEYKLNAVNHHSLHSPFVYDFFTQVLKSDKQYYAFSEIEKYRQELLRNSNEIEIKDLGAGSRTNSSFHREIRDIAKTALSSRRFSEMLFKLCQFTAAKNIIELGTSFGINTLYLAKSNFAAKILSFEGCSETVKIARHIINDARQYNINVVEGDIDKTLDQYLKSETNIDMIYLDANHTYEATLRYFHRFLPCIKPNSVMILDDIYWSKEMFRAWKELINKPEISLSIDIFDAGILFFDQDLQKEHYVLEF